MASRFTDKVVIVTGAGSGIGRATAKMFAAEGAEVVAVDKAASVNETAAEIRRLGRKVEALEMNAGSETDVKAMVRRAVDEFGGLDIFFANAGILGGMPSIFEQMEPAWKEILQVNLIGPMLAIQIAGPEISKRGGGAIVCTASVAGIRPGAGSAAYSASKAGVISLVQVSAHQLARLNVRVNGICPGLIETTMTRPMFDWLKDRAASHRIGQSPMRRAGLPEEIASIALFLASDDSSFINGEVIVAEGGVFSGAGTLS